LGDEHAVGWIIVAWGQPARGCRANKIHRQWTEIGGFEHLKQIIRRIELSEAFFNSDLQTLAAPAGSTGLTSHRLLPSRKTGALSASMS
jgi:hypothetical protein